MQGEAASLKVDLNPPTGEYHLYVSRYNLGAKELAEELGGSDVLTNKYAALSWTTDFSAQSRSDHMLVLLDSRTWTSGETTTKLIEEIESAISAGIHLLCVHEFQSVVGPARHECDFALMFDRLDADHLQAGATNLYKEIALALKGAEWRVPGLVALASRIAADGVHVGGHSEDHGALPSGKAQKRRIGWGSNLDGGNKATKPGVVAPQAVESHEIQLVSA